MSRKQCIQAVNIFGKPLLESCSEYSHYWSHVTERDRKYVEEQCGDLNSQFDCTHHIEHYLSDFQLFVNEVLGEVSD